MPKENGVLGVSVSTSDVFAVKIRIRALPADNYAYERQLGSVNVTNRRNRRPEWEYFPFDLPRPDIPTVLFVVARYL